LQPAYQRIGIQDGLRSPADIILTEQVRVVARQSTDVLAIDDPDVRSALRFIREHACEGIAVDDVLKHVTFSRATLKRRFATLLGRSPKTEILRLQLGCVKDILAMTELPLERVAELAGFNHVEHMCKLFKKRTGQTPGQYRAANRSGAYRRPWQEEST
jgi:LacI family transcriptional regulator